ncbi:major facilitator superfamily domain-containing protein [Aspergillus ambiguus]|uniref:major facilitator superfamily domain-containing protein n=1 Tax=Aspergillus ambiguus TaxID=176160 RepID=UPI003CCD62E9
MRAWSTLRTFGSSLSPPRLPRGHEQGRETKAVWKLDRVLISLLGGLYLCSYMDWGNVGNAYTASMGKSWDIISSQYSMVVTIYYIAYTCFHWLILAWKVVPLPDGGVALDMIQASTVKYTGLLVCRILVGIFEAGFVPAITLYLSFFYHRREMGLRYGLFISYSPFANALAPAIAYGVGAPTIVLAAIAYFYLPNGPIECPFLSERSNFIIGQRAVIGRGRDQGKKINFEQAFAAFYDCKNYLLNTAFGSPPAHLPAILANMGFSAIQPEGLSEIPYLSACVFCITLSFISDYFQLRGLFIAFFAALGGAEYVILAVVTNNAVCFFAFAICAGNSQQSLTFTWVTNNQRSSSKRGVGLAIFGMIGQCGPLLGARLFPSIQGPIVLFGAAVCSIILRQLVSLENARRDREHGSSDPQYASPDIADQGDEHPIYRFVL